MKKLVKRTVLAVLLLVVVATAVVYFRLNSIVRLAIERQSSTSLELPTTLGGARLAIFGGKLSLDDFAVGSPAGFSAPHLLTLDDADLAVQYGQLRGDPVRIRHITLERPKVVIEHANGKFNFQALADRKPPAGEPVKVIIDQLDIVDAEVILRPGLPGLDKEIKVKVPTLSLKNIGNADGAQNGVAIRQVVIEVVTSLADKGGELGNLPDLLKKQLQAQANETINRARAELSGKVRDALKDTPFKGVDVPRDIDKGINKEVDKLLGGGGKKK
jgi:uncharacterized protein involved in outer membrane biogenesis